MKIETSYLGNTLNVTALVNKSVVGVIETTLISKEAVTSYMESNALILSPNATKNNWVYVNRMYVDPEYRQQGVATKLLINLLDSCRIYKLNILHVVNPQVDVRMQGVLKLLNRFNYTVLDVNEQSNTALTCRITTPHDLRSFQMQAMENLRRRKLSYMRL